MVSTLGCQGQGDILPAKEGVVVAATIFPLADIARNVAGPHAEVVQVLPAGASPHSFSPRPADIVKLQEAKAMFMIGHGLDDWALELTQSLPGMEPLVLNEGIELMEFEHEHGHEDEEENENEEEHEEGLDPHYWLSPTNAKLIARNVAEYLAQLDPQNADAYQENLASYEDKLDSLREEVGQILFEKENRHLVVFHDSWNYFAREFGLEVVGTFQPSPGQEPSPAQLAELYHLVEENDVKTIYSEPQLSPEVLRPFLEDMGLELAVLDPLGGTEGRLSYADLILHNARIIAQSL